VQAVDREGRTVDFRLSRRRNVAATKAFFRKALKRQFDVSTLRIKDKTAPDIWNLVLAAWQNSSDRSVYPPLNSVCTTTEAASPPRENATWRCRSLSRACGTPRLVRPIPIVQRMSSGHIEDSGIGNAAR
jgi:hypothetical protein